MSLKNDGGKLSERYLQWSEAEFENEVIAFAKKHGWKVAHFRPAMLRDGRWVTPMKGDTGFPDLVLARNGVVYHWELKAHGRKPSKEQVEWIQALEGQVLWPEQWPWIQATLGRER